MGRRKKTSKKNLAYRDFILEAEGLSAGDEVVYKRISDGVTSLGEIRYFHPGKTLCATVVDYILQNYQTAIVSEIIREPDPELVRKIKNKVKINPDRRPKKK